MPDQTITQNVTNTTALPEWMTNYYQQLLGPAVAAGQAAYQPYGGFRVAGFTDDQNQAFDAIRGIQGMLTPTIQRAMDGTAAAGSVNSGAAATADYGQARDIFGRVAGSTTSGISQPFVDQGTDYLRQAAAGNSLGLASPYVQQSVAPQGLSAAYPWMQAAGTSFPGMAGAYMNPYNQLVTDRIAQLGARNLSENLLPQISDQFVRSGQYGSPQQRDFIGRVLRDTNESILNQQAQVLQQGYGQAGQLYGQDAARYAGLAGTAGGLGTQQQQLLQQAGSTLGNLSATDLARLAAAGVNIGNLGLGQAGVAGADYQRQLAAGQGIAGLGQSLINASQADANRQLQASGQLMNIGTQAELSRLRQIGALAGAGEAQQGLNQQSLDTAYQDFQRQNNYPWQQVANLGGALQGIQPPTSSSETTQRTQPGPSTLSQIGGLGLGIAGLLGSGTPGRARGGAVRRTKYKRAQSYGTLPRRGLDIMREAA